MSAFTDTKNKINTLTRAEYRYDGLVSAFALHYLELSDFGYKPLPDISILHEWLRHLNLEIRPQLREQWDRIGKLFGFDLGDRIQCGDTELYAIRMSADPGGSVVRIYGFGVKKDGSPSQTVTSVEIKERSKVSKLDGCLKPAELENLLFPGSSSLPRVKVFLNDQLKKLK